MFPGVLRALRRNARRIGRLRRKRRAGLSRQNGVRGRGGVADKTACRRQVAEGSSLRQGGGYAGMSRQMEICRQNGVGNGLGSFTFGSFGYPRRGLHCAAAQILNDSARKPAIHSGKRKVLPFGKRFKTIPSLAGIRIRYRQNNRREGQAGYR